MAKQTVAYFDISFCKKKKNRHDCLCGFSMVKFFDNIVHIYDRNIQLLELVVSILLSKRMFNSIGNILFIATIKMWKPHRFQ